MREHKPDRSRLRQRAADRQDTAGSSATAQGDLHGREGAAGNAASRDAGSRRRLAMRLQRQIGNRRAGAVLGAGQGLDPGTRAAAEGAYGADFAGVRLHTDAPANQLAGSLEARAVSFGRNIAFGSGEYRPGTLDGDAVLAHELAHVAQQQDPGRPGAVADGSAGTAEIEADADRSAAIGLGALRGDTPVPAGSGAPTLRSKLRFRRCGAAVARPATATPAASSATLTVTGAARFAADSYVTIAGSTVTVAITGIAAPPGGGAIPPGTVTWTGGNPGADQLHRLVPTGAAGSTTITASGGGRSGHVAIHVVAATPLPATNPPATLRHILLGAAANPGANFGITVVTIGQQGVTGPELDVTAHLDGARWRFRVSEIRHRYKVGINGHGHTNISGPGDPAITPATIGPIIADLTPPGAGAATGPPRATFWSQSITRAHEQAHVDRFYTFWSTQMRTLETEIEAASAPFDPATAGSAAAVLAAQRPSWQARANTLHAAADAAEISGSEPAAHGVSNPMYTALINSIRHSVAPPAPTALAAVPGSHTATLSWTPANVVNTTGFVIQRRIGTGAFVDVGTVAPGVHTFTDTTAPPGAVTYRVLAAGAAGRSAPSPLQTVTIGP